MLEHQHTFAKDSTDIGFCPLLQHDIDTGDAAPIKQSPRCPPLAALDAEDEILSDMLKAGVIEDTGDAAPIKQSPRCPPLAALDAEDEILNDMLKAGVIEPSFTYLLTYLFLSSACLLPGKWKNVGFCHSIGASHLVGQGERQ